MFGFQERTIECRRLCAFLPAPEFDGYCNRCVAPEFRSSMCRSSWMSNLEMAAADGDLQSAMEYLDTPFFNMDSEPLSRFTSNALKQAMRRCSKNMVKLLYERQAINFDEEPMLHLLAFFNTVCGPRRKQKELFDYLISLEEVRGKIEQASSLQTLMGYPVAHVDREKRDLIVDLLCGGSEPSSPVLAKLARLTREEFQISGWDVDEGEEHKHEQSPKKARTSPERSSSKRSREREEEWGEEEFVRIFLPHDSDEDSPSFGRSPDDTM